MALKDYIKQNHDKAENHPFVQVLLSGNISSPIYADYLLNQLICYGYLEAVAKINGLFYGIEAIERGPLIQQDFSELLQPATVHPSTFEYVQHVSILPVELLWAHIYAKHFGDMYGGQIIKKAVPSRGAMYHFDDRQGLISKVREKLTDDLADEANKALEFSLKLFDEIANAHNIAETYEQEPL